jgi:hypothetical protein
MTNRCSVLAMLCAFSLSAVACAAPNEGSTDPAVETSGTINPEICNGACDSPDDPAPTADRPNLMHLSYTTVLEPPRTVYPGTQWEKTFRLWLIKVTVKNNGKQSMKMAGVHFKMMKNDGTVMHDYVDISNSTTVLAPGQTRVLSYPLGHAEDIGMSLSPYKVLIGLDDDAYGSLATTPEVSELDNIKTYDL